jgi:O-antigen ligase
MGYKVVGQRGIDVTTIENPANIDGLREPKTRNKYPLLYWTTFAYIVGVPNFVHFDSTGRTANPINITSISVVILTAVAGYLLIAMLLLGRQGLMVRRLRIYGWIWIALLIELAVATALGPAGHVTPVTTASRLLAFYRIGQWAVAFSLIVALVSRTPPEYVPSLVTRLIGQISWTWVAMVWLLLPIIPSQVYGGAEDDPHAVRRLGGQLLTPAHVTLLASIGVFYALLFFPRGPRKWIALFIALPTLILTGARAQLAGFLVSYLVYALVLSRKATIRWATVGIVLFLGVMLIPFSSVVGRYIARGQSAESLASLNDRTRVWQASLDAIELRPLLGYGYNAGARAAIRDHWKYAHWVPPHAHNEFLEAALAGGIPALLLFLAIYLLVLLNAGRDLRFGTTRVFLFLVFVQFVMDAITGGTLGFAYRETGGIFLLCAVGILSNDRRPRTSVTFSKRQRRTALDRTPAPLVHSVN